MKCVITKFKEAVNDSSLTRLGEVKCIISSNSNEILSVGSRIGKKVTYTITGTGYFTDYSEETNYGQTYVAPEYSSGSSMVIRVKTTSEETLSIIDKNDCSILSTASAMNIHGLDGQILSTLTNLQRLNLSSVVSPQYSVSDFSSLTLLDDLVLQKSNIQGEIKDFGKLVLLTRLIVSDTPVTGTLESLANAMLANGRTSGTLDVYASGTTVTFEGAGFGKKTITFQNGSYSIA